MTPTLKKKIFELKTDQRRLLQTGTNNRNIKRE